MCRLHTEGTQHGCGHYIITRKVFKRDCNSPYCMKSICHQQTNCPYCPTCTRYYHPDEIETITKRTGDSCKECAYWFEGPGARHKT